jgi:hypothetical protein
MMMMISKGTNTNVIYRVIHDLVTLLQEVIS